MTTAWFSDVRLLAQPSSVPRAREFVRLQLFEHLLSSLTDDVELVVSELATNALVHAQTAFRVVLGGFKHTLRLGVEDGSRAGPIQVVPRVLDTGGRGIAILNLLTRDWGVDSPAGGGRSVWAEFDLEPGDGDEGRVVHQDRLRTSTERPSATGGSIDSSHSEELLSNLLWDVKEGRAMLQRARVGGSSEAAIRAAHAQLVESLTRYVEALGARRLPVPYLLRDELRLYGRTSAAYDASRWGHR
jgi:hypothetical protein